MLAVELEGLVKRFGGVDAVAGVSLSIRPGEFFTLLGPSGCGKTTLLRILAGLEAADAGAVRFGGQRVDMVPAHRRNTGMVFQNYALFPHLAVADNVAYGLRARQLPAPEVRSRVAAALELVRMGGLGDRRPEQLSGGQQQRVALARALAVRPDLLLMDEPLSNLDAKLRVEMRTEIKALQQRLGITTVYVTHDQEEALAVSDRIAVMHQGRVCQVGSPAEVYHCPAGAFVAGFVGTTSFLPGPEPGVQLALRPEQLRIAGPGQPLPPGAPALPGIVAAVAFMGAYATVAVQLDVGVTAAVLWPQPGLELPAAAGARVLVTYRPADARRFAVATGEALP